ncbi:MAG: transcriptional repressor LexA [Pirellulaceae bacterium]
MKQKRSPGRPRVDAITPRQRRTQRAIETHIRRHGFPPTIQELAELCGITPPSAHDQVNQLIRKGYLKREPRKARGLVVLRKLAAPVADLQSVPLVGCVAAGYPLLAEENVVGEVLVEGLGLGRHFALEVAGESMKKAGIRHGDVVIVRQQPIAESGDIVLAAVDGEHTVKRLSVSQETIELRPENTNFRPIPIGSETELRILGKVVAVRRR